MLRDLRTHDVNKEGLGVQWSILILTLTLIFTLSAQAQKYSVRFLGSYGKHVIPSSINNQGDVVGYYYLDRTVAHPFLWTKTSGFQDLGTLGGDMSLASSINDQGEIVGFAQAPIHMTAFRWTAATGMVDLDPLDSGDSFAFANNQMGSVAGSTFGGSSPEVGVIWRKNGEVITIGTGSLTAINNKEQVVGLTAATSNNGFLWSEADGMVQLPALGDGYSRPASINDLGQVVGWSGPNNADFLHAFLWTQADGVKDLGTLGGSWSRANAINRKGQVVGSSATPTNNDGVAFLWTKWAGMRDLKRLIPTLPDWQLLDGADINDFGQIAVRARRGTATQWRAVILSPLMSTTLKTSANPAPTGIPVIFTATVSNSIQGRAPNGATVTFKDGRKVLGTVPLQAGTASFSTASLAPGIHSITAVYSGDVHYDSTKSDVLTQTMSMP